MGRYETDTRTDALGAADPVDLDEEAVRRYLIALDDPAALVDRAEIDELQRRMAQTDDVIERLRLQSTIFAHEHVDLAGIERDFVRRARRYARRSDIPTSAFVVMGVPDSVLERAGFERAGRRRTTRPRPRRGGSVRERVLAALTSDDQRTVRDIVDATGADEGAIRRTLAELVATGVVTLDPPQAHDGPGRAPRHYRRR